MLIRYSFVITIVYHYYIKVVYKVYLMVMPYLKSSIQNTLTDIFIVQLF